MMAMEFMTALGLLVFIVFLVIYFFASQKLYQTRYSFLLLLLLFFSTIALLGFLFITYKKHDVKVPFLLLSFCFYMVMIIGIKAYYKKINNFLVSKNMVNNKFGGKEYTFAFVFLYTLVWDKKKASPPSWFDSLLSMALLVIPLLLAVLSGGAID